MGSSSKQPATSTARTPSRTQTRPGRTHCFTTPHAKAWLRCCKRKVCVPPARADTMRFRKPSTLSSLNRHPARRSAPLGACGENRNQVEYEDNTPITAEDVETDTAVVRTLHAVAEQMVDAPSSLHRMTTTMRVPHLPERRATTAGRNVHDDHPHIKQRRTFSSDSTSSVRRSRYSTWRCNG